MENLGLNNWIVTANEKELFDQIFDTLDIDNDGFIIGTDDCVKKIFLKTALVHTVLAHIWNLCDIKQNGMLNSEQFALAMHLVNEAKKGVQLPSSLTPEMIPPTLRPKPILSHDQSNQDLKKFNEPKKFTNKELEILSEELKELEEEKHCLEHEVTQQETHIKLKENEIKSIQNEIETLIQMIKQLENQKIEATKRLDEMDLQVELLKQQLEEHQKKNAIEEQLLSVKKEEFEGLKSEEQKIETQVNLIKNELEKISSKIADSQLLACKYKTKKIDLEEYENNLNDEIKEFDICIASKDFHRLNVLIAKQLQPPEGLNSTKNNDGFNENNDFPSLSTEFAVDPFAGEDPFANETTAKPEDLFANDAFANAFIKSNNDEFQDPFSSKPGFEELTPQLPPKKKKGPPPRPEPPKSIKPLSKVVQNDPWGNSNANDPFASSNNFNSSNSENNLDSFADFANFDKAFQINQVDPFSPIKSNNKIQNTLNSNNINFDTNNLNNFDTNNLNNFDTNWSAFGTTDFDPFAPESNKKIEKSSNFNFFENDDKNKQIQDDYEFAIKLSQNDFKYQAKK